MEPIDRCGHGVGSRYVDRYQLDRATGQASVRIDHRHGQAHAAELVHAAALALRPG